MVLASVLIRTLSRFLPVLVNEQSLETEEIHSTIQSILRDCNAEGLISDEALEHASQVIHNWISSVKVV